MSVAAAMVTPLLQLRGIETFYGKIQALPLRRLAELRMRATS